MANYENYKKLNEILSKWNETHSLLSLTSEMKEYLFGVIAGIDISREEDIKNQFFKKIIPLLKELKREQQTLSHENRIHIGKIQFDCRILEPSINYNITFDENEKYFIEHGKLNEKELTYLEKQRNYEQNAKEKLRQIQTNNKKSEEELQENIIKFKDAEMIPILKNYVKLYGMSMIGKNFLRLSELLKQKKLDFDPSMLRSILNKISNELEYEIFTKRILSNNPAQISEYIKNFLEIYGESYAQKINLLEKLLNEKNISIENLELKINEIKNKLELEKFEQILSEESPITIDDSDKMTGKDFEICLVKLFKKMSYLVEPTKNSGDQGADLVVEKLDKKMVIQVKRSSSKISNKAVQEVGAAIKYYGAESGMVVTNNYFQNSAVELAKSNGIELIDRKRLAEWLETYPISKLTKSSTKSNLSSSSDDLPLLRDEILLDVLTKLEGSERKPIPIRMFVKHLIKTGKFSESSAMSLINEMEFDEKIYQSKEEYYNTMTKEIRQQREIERKEEEIKRGSEVSRMQLFMEILRSLEGEPKQPVEDRLFVSELVKSGKFTEEEARNYIRRMLREASIFECKPRHYNRV